NRPAQSPAKDSKPSDRTHRPGRENRQQYSPQAAWPRIDKRARLSPEHRGSARHRLLPGARRSTLSYRLRSRLHAVEQFSPFLFGVGLQMHVPGISDHLVEKLWEILSPLAPFPLRGRLPQQPPEQLRFAYAIRI